MKEIIISIVFCLNFTQTHAQIENPYSIFNYNGKVIQTDIEEYKNQALVLNKTDSSEIFKIIKINKTRNLVEFNNNSVCKIDTLTPTIIFRFISPDPHSNSYPAYCPYIFVNNMPIRAIDPDGRDIFILFYTSGNDRGDEMFYAAALTRMADIKRSSAYDPKKDFVVLCDIQDMSSIQKRINNIVAIYSPAFGQTQEFSIWSHAGKDGPVGTMKTSSNSIDDYQLSIQGWNQIDFNWKNNGHYTKANFFGCNTGANSLETYANGTSMPYVPIFYDNPIPNSSFAAKISALDNFNNVIVSGQTSSAYPSQFVDYRINSQNGEDNFINYENNKEVNFQRTYLVGGIGRSQDIFGIKQDVANPMQLNKNGQTIGTEFQTTTSRKP
jgi:hypothetical protein